MRGRRWGLTSYSSFAMAAAGNQRCRGVGSSCDEMAIRCLVVRKGRRRPGVTEGGAVRLSEAGP